MNICSVNAVSVMVNDYAILDGVIELVPCHTRFDTVEIIIDTIHLENKKIREQFLQLTGLGEGDIELVNYLILWR